MTKKMNKSLKKKWVKALRSGEYGQGSGLLHDKGKFCCLGVLADVMGILDGGLVYDDAGRCYNGMLPGNRVGGVDPDVQGILVSMNDNHDPLQGPASFHDIADFIEKNL